MNFNDEQKEAVTKKLFECAMLDMMPALNGPTDAAFLINDDNARFGALKWAIRHETTNHEELVKAVGNPKLLAEIVRRDADLYGSRQTNGYATAYPL